MSSLIAVFRIFCQIIHTRGLHKIRNGSYRCVENTLLIVWQRTGGCITEGASPRVMRKELGSDLIVIHINLHLREWLTVAEECATVSVGLAEGGNFIRSVRNSLASAVSIGYSAMTATLAAVISLAPEDKAIRL
jgi:hypothetical protein